MTSFSSFSLITPTVIEKILYSINKDASITQEAKEALANIFNSHTEHALISAHRAASNRASKNLSEELINAKIPDVVETISNPVTTSTLEFRSPLDKLSASLELSDISERLKLPPNCLISLTTADETGLYGPIKSYSSSQSLSISPAQNSRSNFNIE